MLRTPTNHLSQLSKRLSEQMFMVVNKPDEAKLVKKIGTMSRDLCYGVEYASVILDVFTISAKPRDSCVLLKSKKISTVKHIVERDYEGIVILSHTISKNGDFFKHPCKSTQLSMFSIERESETLVKESLKNVYTKCIISWTHKIGSHWTLNSTTIPTDNFKRASGKAHRLQFTSAVSSDSDEEKEKAAAERKKKRPLRFIESESDSFATSDEEVSESPSLIGKMYPIPSLPVGREEPPPKIVKKS
ncbi:hypothetical protein JTE90_004423 [Oedothorax gibbosus]|uniref:Uncharacterized protein n=1 Tax=Oedothorax gibbosus TaxID=931172 RepID=A0AAV6TRG7_9ARAC|nr:hypothetical protein JTE90_004423 [Oedothorax gibbosus]